MSVTADSIRDKQRIIWDQFAAGWKKWDTELLDWQGPFGEALIEDARLHPGASMLDVASGTGEPGLTAAALVPDGHAVLTDISAGMLKVAEVKALARGLQNVRFEVCEAAALPLEEESFDAVFCRFGFVFFPGISPALREMVRTARPGARITAAVWGPAAENPWASLILGTMAHHTKLTARPAGTPGLFRYSAAGLMSRMFRDAGLVDVSERKVSTDLVQASPERYWEFMTEIATTVAVGLASADRDTRELIRSDVFQLLGRYRHDGAIRLRSTANIVAGTRA